MRTKWVTCAFVVVIVGAVAACGGSSNDEHAGDEDALTVELVEQNGSGQSGSATFTPIDEGRTRILLQLTNPPADEQPAHVHSGSCDALGDPVVALTNVVDGRSETEADTSLGELEQGELVVHAHKSEAEYDVSVACAPVQREG